MLKQGDFIEIEYTGRIKEENKIFDTTSEEIAKKTGVNVSYVKWPEIESKIEVGDTIINSGKIDNVLNYKYKFRFNKWIHEL